MFSLFFLFLCVCVMCNQVLNWCVKKMSLSALKSVFMLIFNKSVNWSDFQFSINGSRIGSSHSTVFLGLTLNARLQMTLHVAKKIAATKKAFFSLRSYLRADDRRLRYLLPLSSRTSYYNVCDYFD